MISKAECFGKVIDCRSIVFQAEYDCLSEEKVLQLAENLYFFVTDQFEDQCVISWHIRDRALRHATMIRQTRIQSNEVFSIDAIGDVKSDRVVNKTSLQKYEKDLGNNMIFHMGLVPPFASVDYPEYVSQRLIPFEKDPQAFRQAIINLFSEEGHINRSQSQTHDVTVMFFNKKQIGNHDLFCGDFFIKVSLFCLSDEEVEHLSKQMLGLMRHMAKEYININASIRIAQTKQEFEFYWRGEHLSQDYKGYDSGDGNLQALTAERRKHLYLTSLGWANTLSPVVMDYYNKHKDSSHPAAGVVREELACGGSIYTSEKKLLDFKLIDAKNMKRELYACIVPFYNKMDVHYNGIGGIRSNWENVPVFDEEITIENGKVIISHQMTLDMEYIFANTLF